MWCVLESMNDDPVHFIETVGHLSVSSAPLS